MKRRREDGYNETRAAEKRDKEEKKKKSRVEEQMKE